MRDSLRTRDNGQRNHPRDITHGKGKEILDEREVFHATVGAVLLGRTSTMAFSILLYPASSSIIDLKQQLKRARKRV